MRFGRRVLVGMVAITTGVLGGAGTASGSGAGQSPVERAPVQNSASVAPPGPSVSTSWLAQETNFQPAALDCPTSTVCYAAGTEGPEDSVTASAGIVATSARGSATWRIRSLPVGTPSLSLLACPSAERCVAAPSGIEPTAAPAPPRFVVSTDDGGATWSAQALPGFGSGEPFGLTGLACPTSSRCVVVGHTGNGSGEPYLAVTANGGRTWVTPTLPASVPLLAGVSCLTRTHCLVVGTSIAGGQGRELALTTHDGGRTWAVMGLPRAQVLISGLSCSSASRCLVVGLATIGLPCALVTTDGGRSWTTEWLPSALNVPDSVVCAASACLVGSLTQEADPVLYRSVGAGGRWAKINPLPARRPAGAYGCSGPTRCEAGNAQGLFSSSDRGNRWVGPSASAFPGSAEAYPAAVSCTSARACSVSTIFAGSGEPARYPLMFSTSDGGRSWRRSAVANGGPAPTSISCADSTHCEVLDTGIFSTVDGGASWTVHTVATPSSRSVGVVELGNSISCPTASDCAALVGTVGIARTTDGGRTWRPATVVAPDSAFVDAIDCPVASTCWAVGGRGSVEIPTPGTVLVSTDGGARWTHQRLPVGAEALSDVSCATARHCVAVGVADFGLAGWPGTEIVSTDDGGMTWLTRSVPGGIGSLAAVSCPTASLCLAVGSATQATSAVYASGAVVMSVDGGASWQTEAVPSGTPPLNAISCGASKHCVALGPDAVLTTSKGGAGPAATSAIRSATAAQ